MSLRSPAHSSCMLNSFERRAYSSLGGEVNDNASCTTQAAGQLVCGAIGIGAFDNTLNANVYNGSNWSGWTKIGERCRGRPKLAKG